ncbi:hypothetical protein RchiOBHm_Chr6g0244951 [Rosa chinensis]|uniref:Uncharacterized protein n=1 Tax=Rosa chinensis TaxID=74649 RepID=A0A2P6PJ48_ROSCH|nr:hypothetical protein RchiOBHm_Chr6g0244951 [Rosa chinensis]
MVLTIQNILEDCQMEYEIRHNLVAAASRHSNGRVSSCNLQASLGSAILRDWLMFICASPFCGTAYLSSGNGLCEALHCFPKRS